MIAGKAKRKVVTLTQALAQFLAKQLLPDLKTRAADPGVSAALTRQWEAEKKANRTADGFDAWQARTLEQVGAAWVLSCVFVRTLEDRDLLARRRLAGSGATDSEQLFFELAPSLTARDYLLTVFKEVASLPGAEDLLGPRHNPAWRLSPSNDIARALLTFFREEDADGHLRWRFDGGAIPSDTRFLGDLYQDLSEEVRKRYALLQTPDFVERFILDQTLEPAITEFGLNEVRVIDPTCGSGHFLLGAFNRLLSHHLRAAPATDIRDHALKAIGQVYGVDVNPFAVAIARFRLTLAYLQRAGITKLAQAPRLQLNLVVADSLLHGAKNATMQFAEHELAGEDYEAWSAELFALDDPKTARRLFAQGYHAVVGNPPYINVPDSGLRQAYRDLFPVACHRTFQLVSPFVERFFQLAESRGFVGAIVGNGFMKREFGKPLVEQILPTVDLCRIIDTAGAYIPGHGTPTVLLFGRNQHSTAATIRAVLGKRGEPTTPEVAEAGLVWTSIAAHFDEAGFEDAFISVADVSREVFNRHPWSLGGGGAAELKATIEDRAHKRLGDLIEAIGRTNVCGEDDLWIIPGAACLRNAGVDLTVPLVIGEVVRDWAIRDAPDVIYPYKSIGGDAVSADHPVVSHYLWRYRTLLQNRTVFGKTMKAKGDCWYEHLEHYRDKLQTPLSIAFAFVATHNHFVLERGGKVFKQTAPIIKLPESANEDDHLALLAYLNSSTACFWMKQVMMNKGATSGSGVLQADPEKFRFEFDGTKLKLCPVPEGLRHFRNGLLMEVARTIDVLAAQCSGAVLLRTLRDTAADDLAGALSNTLAAMAEARGKMIALQEEADWLIYELYELLPANHPAASPLTTNSVRLLPGVTADERPYRSPERTGVRNAGLPAHIEMIEVPEFKRRWFRSAGKFDGDNVSDEDVLATSCKTLLLDDIERMVASTARPVAATGIVRTAENDPKQHGLAEQLWSADAIAENLLSLLDGDTVPFVSSARFTMDGLANFNEWRQTWDLQRREDLGESVGEIPVPPKYDQKDYRDANYWRLRGKLDVAKERFISYPGCEKDGDPSPLIGWAGWNHLQRAQALVALYQERKNDDGWPAARLMPMLVGLHELMFWLELWHSQPEAGSKNPAREFKQFLDAELNAHGLTVEDLEAWRPLSRKNVAAKRSAAKVNEQPFISSDTPGIITQSRIRERKTATTESSVQDEATKDIS